MDRQPAELAEAVATLRAILTGFGCPPHQVEAGVLLWTREHGNLEPAAWKQARQRAAALVCVRCGDPERYSPPKYFKRKTGERLHAVLGRPRRFRTCLATTIVNMARPTDR
jgi:hypothetical protein